MRSDVFLTPTYFSRLEKACSTLNIELTQMQSECLLKYLSLMLKWNKTYNLTAITDPEQMLIHHVLDSLAIIPHLVSRVNQDQPALIMDVGSGGGLPAVVIAIMCPKWKVQSVDAVEKKTSFVRQVASVLGLKNLYGIHARIEALDSQDADLIISRAFASLADFVTWSHKHLAEQGMFAAMKGVYPQQEIDELLAQTSFRVMDSQPLVIPNLEAQRCILFINKK